MPRRRHSISSKNGVFFKESVQNLPAFYQPICYSGTSELELKLVAEDLPHSHLENHTIKTFENKFPPYKLTWQRGGSVCTLHPLAFRLSAFGVSASV
jgi:hypothetical protein